MGREEMAKIAEAVNILDIGQILRSKGYRRVDYGGLAG